MKKNLKYGFVLMAICMTFSPLVKGQQVYKINESKVNNMKLLGTSTLHKWDMDAQTFTGRAEFDFKPGTTNQISHVKALSFSLVVKDLKSGERGLDNNAYKALKTDKYKDIDYTLTSATIIPENPSQSLIHTQGNLVIAGVTRGVTMDVNCIVNKDETITCKGSDKLNMSDFAVKPPSFMAGAMKTGDAITLDFTLVYQK